MTVVHAQIGLVGRLQAMNGGMVGASTGYMRSMRGRWPELVARAREVSAAVVELSTLSADEVAGLSAFLDREGVSGFAVVMMHGPAKGIDRLAARDLVELLDPFRSAVDGIVMHPETLADLDRFTELGASLILENMDARKTDARTVGELERYFAALPDARFCLDVAHASMFGADMRRATELLDAFGDRLAEVHVSSIDRSGHHLPLSASDLGMYEPVLERCSGVPWVLEAEARS